MKSGLLSGLHAIDVLRELSADDRWPAAGRAIFLANPDEEIGSPSSTALIERHAAGADVALILEAARANGDLVIGRKGMLGLEISMVGRSAHAGVEPDKGRSAILEAAHKTVLLHALGERWDDVTVNVGVVRGGTRPNIVPADASISVDIRASTSASLDAVEAAAREVARTSSVEGVEASVKSVMRWEPMEPSEASSRLVGVTRRLARDIGFELGTATTGGASDGNTTSAAGVPTLDGLGPIGGGAHSTDEYLEVESVVPRTTLLAALLLELEHGAAHEDGTGGDA